MRPDARKMLAKESMSFGNGIVKFNDANPTLLYKEKRPKQNKHITKNIFLESIYLIFLNFLNATGIAKINTRSNPRPK